MPRVPFETKTVDLRLLDNRASGLHPESLESALRVEEWKAGEQTHDEVENLAALLALPWLALAN